eukprot:scaffold272334_cov33-Tisochrysis_lutea.AAC.1
MGGNSPLFRLVGHLNCEALEHLSDVLLDAPTPWISARNCGCGVVCEVHGLMSRCRRLLVVLLRTLELKKISTN